MLGALRAPASRTVGLCGSGNSEKQDVWRRTCEWLGTCCRSTSAAVAYAGGGVHASGQGNVGTVETNLHITSTLASFCSSAIQSLQFRLVATARSPPHVCYEGTKYAGLGAVRSCISLVSSALDARRGEREANIFLMERVLGRKVEGNVPKTLPSIHDASSVRRWISGVSERDRFDCSP